MSESVEVAAQVVFDRLRAKLSPDLYTLRWDDEPGQVIVGLTKLSMICQGRLEDFARDYGVLESFEIMRLE